MHHVRANRAATLPLWCLCLAALGISLRVQAETLTVTGMIEVTRSNSQQKTPSPAAAVVWLTRVGGTLPAAAPASPQRHFTMIQRNKTFEPHMMVVPTGAEVEFPNKDPFFHNVFSLYDGKRFDLHLYEAGGTRSLRFDRPGISYLFCNIHPEMSAVIIALATPYYGTSDRDGKITIANVPAGQYTLHVWREGASAEALQKLSKTIEISPAQSSFGTLHVPDGAHLPLKHKNKYGQDYESPNPPGQIYSEP